MLNITNMQLILKLNHHIKLKHDKAKSYEKSLQGNLPIELK